MIPPIIENMAGRFMNVTLSHEFVSWMGWTNEPPKVSGRYWLRYFYATKREFSTAVICDFDADEQGGGKAVRVCHDGVRTGVTRHMYFWPDPITPLPI